MEIKEIWSYAVGLLAYIYNMLPITCEGWTDLFALLIVMATFFFVSLPRMVIFFKNRRDKINIINTLRKIRNNLNNKE